MKKPANARPPVRLQRQTMAGQVAEELRRRILSGEHNEGEQLMQEQLASEFGVSKVPVREALHMLEAEGLVTQQFHRGAVVAGISPEQLMELFELRAQIEGWLLTLAMPDATKKHGAAAREINDRLGRTDDPVVAWDLNWRFHEALYIPADKPFILDHLRNLHSKTARYVRLQYSKATSQAEIVGEHAEIIDFYMRKDPGAGQLLSDHILKAARKLTGRLAQMRLEGAES